MDKKRIIISIVVAVLAVASVIWGGDRRAAFFGEIKGIGINIGDTIIIKNDTLIVSDYSWIWKTIHLVAEGKGDKIELPLEDYVESQIK